MMPYIIHLVLERTTKVQTMIGRKTVCMGMIVKEQTVCFMKLVYPEFQSMSKLDDM